MINFSQNLTDITAPIDSISIYQSICYQYKSYIITTGIGIISLNILLHWFCWWFFNHGYKKIEIEEGAFKRYIGNLDNLETRAYWDIFIKHKLNLLMMGFISVIVWLQIR